MSGHTTKHRGRQSSPIAEDMVTEKRQSRDVNLKGKAVRTIRTAMRHWKPENCSKVASCRHTVILTMIRMLTNKSLVQASTKAINK